MLITDDIELVRNAYRQSTPSIDFISSKEDLDSALDELNEATKG
jgi:hypothetical protein